MTPEGKVKELIKKWLKARDIAYWMIIPSGYGSTTGVADFIGILPSGTFIAIEAKGESKKGNVTPNQQKFLNTINDNNGIAVVVASQEDLDNLEKLIGV